MEISYSIMLFRINANVGSENHKRKLWTSCNSV